MTRCYIGLGSNLHSPKRQLNQGIDWLRKTQGLRIIGQSSLYITEPWGVRGQPSFYNMVILIETRLPALTILDICQSIEKKQGRIRKKLWGPRTLDMDILLYGDQIIQTPRLTVPHPLMLKRDFVMRPLQELQH